MTLREKVEEYEEMLKDGGVPPSEISKRKNVLKKYAAVTDELSEESIENYMKEHHTLSSPENRQKYKATLRQFLRYVVQGVRLPRVGCGKNRLLDIIKHESYVDEERVLRVKYSGAVAPYAWIKAAKEVIDFDSRKTKKLRKERQKELEKDNTSPMKQKKTKRRKSDENKKSN